MKALVTILTMVLIAGLITVIWLLVTRVPQIAGTPSVPPAIRLPEGVVPQAVTLGRNWTAIVTDDSRIMIFDKAGALAQTVEVTLP